MTNKIIINVNKNNYSTKFLRTIHELSIELLGNFYCSGSFQSIQYTSEKPINLYYISEGHRYYERDTFELLSDGYNKLLDQSDNCLFRYINQQLKYLR